MTYDVVLNQDEIEKALKEYAQKQEPDSEIKTVSLSYDAGFGRFDRGTGHTAKIRIIKP